MVPIPIGFGGSNFDTWLESTIRTVIILKQWDNTGNDFRWRVLTPTKDNQWVFEGVTLNYFEGKQNNNGALRMWVVKVVESPLL